MSKVQLKVYESSPEKPVTLRLVQNGDEINLVVVDGDGDQENHLITFYADGTVGRSEEIDTDYGFNLNDDGRLVFDDEA